jgi:malate synthase
VAVTGVRLDDGRPLTAERYRAIRDEELAALTGADAGSGHLAEAAGVLDALVVSDVFEPFLTPRAYALLD